MSLASNLLQLIFSLIVGIASLLGALFIIGFLLAVPRNDFEGDDHDVTQPIFLPLPEECPLQRDLDMLPVDCAVVDTGLQNFSRTSCDNTICESCSEDENVTCCCRDSTTTNFTFMCVGAQPRPFIQPDTCSCQPCGNVSVRLTFQVISSTDGNILNNAMINITDSESTVSLRSNSAGFFITFREVRLRTVEVTTSAPDHLPQTLTINILPPGPIEVVVILAAAVVQSFDTNVNTPLNFNVGQLVSVDIPENTVINLDGELFEGEVNVRTVFFSMDQSTFSSEFPPEVTVSSGGALTFYTTRVLARTELFDVNENTLNIGTSLSLSVDFSQFDPASGDTVSLLLYDALLGTWVEQSTFNITPVTTGGKRQVGRMTGVASLPSTDTFWAIALPIESAEICYLQVRTFEGEDILTGVTVSVEQFRDQLGDPFFFRSVGETGDGSGPVGNSACVEVLCGSVTSGRISAAFNMDTLDPSETQPNGLTANGSTITFTSTTEGTPPSPFYTTLGGCMAASTGDANNFVEFDAELEPPPIIVPPVEVPENFWFVRVDVLGCFDSNRASTISLNPTTDQASVFTDTVTATNDFVTIPTTISPEACSGQVTRRTTCVEAYSDSIVTLQAELNQANTVSGQLCFLSELTELLGNSVTRRVRTAELDLTTLNNGNRMAGLYFGENRFSTLDQCLNPLNTDGVFAQFECFEHPADSLIVDLPAGCEDTTFTSQTCSQVPCTTDTGDCTDGNGVQCCYQGATDTEVSITCPPYNTLTFNQPQTCSCMPCDDIMIDVIVTVTSSADGQPLMGAMVEYTVAGSSNVSTMTDSLGMFTVTQPISNGSVAFTIMESNHVTEVHPPVDLIPPGPIRISVVLRSQVTETRDPTMNNVINVGGIATATLTQLTSNVRSLVSYIAAEMPQSFDTTLPPPVVTSDGTYYAVRIIAATRLTEDNGTSVSSSADIEITFSSTEVPDDTTRLSLLTFDNSLGVWNDLVMTLSSPTPPVTATATLSNTELPWAIGNPINTAGICYVQMRTFRRDNNPLEDVEVEVLQLFEQFNETFFFRSVGMTGDASASPTHAACLPVLCNNDGIIRARYHVYLDANVAQPLGFNPAGQSVNKTTTSRSDNGPLFSSAATCSTGGEYLRFDLPIANPPPADIEPDTNDDGFVFLRVSWYDCLESNQVFTVSSDSSSNILAIYGITVGEMGEIDDGLHSRVNNRLLEYLSSGDGPVNCADSPTAAVTSRTACIQVEPNSNVTLQVELNPQSNMLAEGNGLCSLNKTIGSLMEGDASDNRLRFDLQELRSQFNPQMNMTMLNDMGIYYDANSASVAYSQCMDIEYSNDMTELYGSIAVFSCFTP